MARSRPSSTCRMPITATIAALASIGRVFYTVCGSKGTTITGPGSRRPIRRFTIFTDTQPISIFRAGDVYLIVIHDAFRFSKALLKRCERISQEIARLSSQRVTV